MNKRKVAIFVSGGIIVIALVAGIIVFKDSKKSNDTNQNGKSNVLSIGDMKYELKEETKENLDKSKYIKNDKEFKISEVKEDTGKLIVTVNSEIDNPDEAYQTATILENSIKDINKDKIEKDGIKNVQIVLKGSSKSWLYDNSNSIKEINIK